MKFIRYWGSKPNQIILDLILSNSEPNDLVLDPFGGKGGTAIEAIKSHRRIIYNDLNPYAFFVAKTLATPVNKNELEKAFSTLIHKLNLKKYKIKIGRHNKLVTFNWLYSTKCKCGAVIKIRQVLWSLLYQRNMSRQIISNDGSKLNKIAKQILEIIPEDNFTHAELINQIRKSPVLSRIKANIVTRAINSVLVKNNLLRIVGEKPLYIIYDKPCGCGLRGKEPENSDLIKIKRICTITTLGNYPCDELRYPNGEFFFKRRIVSTIDELFTKRNAIALATILKEIESLNHSRKIKNALLLCLSSILFASSKMQKPKGGSWPVASYWIPPIFVEQNVLKLFILRFRRFIKWKEKVTAECNYFISTEIKDVLKGKARGAFLAVDARKLPLPDNSVDYIFVDPPQTDEIQFFELSFLASRWLNLSIPFEDEIVVNPRQGKTEDDYWEMLEDALRESVRVLKPGKRITVLLHGESPVYFENFKNILSNLGLKMISNKFKKYCFKNGLHKYDKRRLNGDYYITLEKRGYI